MKYLILFINTFILCFLYSYSFAQIETSLSSNIEYFCKECDYKLFKSDDFKLTVKDSKSNSYEINVYEKQSGYFCKVTNLQSKTNSNFQIEGQWMLDIGYIKLDSSSSNILIITGIGGSGGTGKVFNLINLESMNSIYLSYIKMGQNLPDLSKSKNFSNLKAESEFIDKLKFQYGFIDEEYIKNNTTNPDKMMEVWKYYNNEINNGKTRTFTFAEIPEYYNVDSENAKLETDEYIFTAYHKSGVIAFNKSSNLYFAIFVPKDSYSWVQVMVKYKNYLLLGTRLEGLAVINLDSYVLKRYDLGKNYNDVKKISVANSRILINESKQIDFSDF
ncbi:MAG: hypothetical protein WCG45_04410 [bacterium]